MEELIAIITLYRDFKELDKTPGQHKFENSDFLYLLNQAPGEGLIIFDRYILPFVDKFPTNTKLYSIMTTRLEEVATVGARNWAIAGDIGRNRPIMVLVYWLGGHNTQIDL